MGRIVWRFILFLIPILMIIGIFRTVLHPDESFLPSAEVLMRIFSATPDFQTYIASALTAYQNTSLSLQNISVYDVPSFFNAIGVFFQTIGSALWLGFRVIQFPFEVLIFVFTNVLGFGSIS